jgi:hypothetical protein
LVLGAVLHLPLRQTEGFVRSLMEVMTLDLAVPDHTTLARWRRTVEINDWRWPRKGLIDIVIGSMGLKFCGMGSGRAPNTEKPDACSASCISRSIPPATRS